MSSYYGDGYRGNNLNAVGYSNANSSFQRNNNANVYERNSQRPTHNNVPGGNYVKRANASNGNYGNRSNIQNDDYSYTHNVPSSNYGNRTNGPSTSSYGNSQAGGSSNYGYSNNRRSNHGNINDQQGQGNYMRRNVMPSSSHVENNYDGSYGGSDYGDNDSYYNNSQYSNSRYGSEPVEDPYNKVSKMPSNQMPTQYLSRQPTPKTPQELAALRAPIASPRVPHAASRVPQAAPRAPQAAPRAPQATPRAPQATPRSTHAQMSPKINQRATHQTKNPQMQSPSSIPPSENDPSTKRKYIKKLALPKHIIAGARAKQAQIRQAKAKARAQESRGSVDEIRRIPERTKNNVNYVSKCVKYLLFSFNFLFWLAGLGIAGLGAWIVIEKDKKVRDILDFVFDPSILLAASGLVMVVLSFFGFLGALRENLCLLKSFHGFLSLILLLEMAIGVLVFLFYFMPEIREKLGFLDPGETLQHAVIRYREDDDLRDMIDIMQREFHCCGFSNDDRGYKDWDQNLYFNCSESNPSRERCGVPYSCCVPTGNMINVMCGYDTTNRELSVISSKIYTQGCVKGFGVWLERNTILMGAASLGIIIPQVIGICLARTLVEQIETQKAQWR
ncbi:unnamed protein product [Owenia fusiformis]|uniref:Tetraspanin-33 n=1 Tax=Owenia fusiformis TaxID=6347 RepID=A0A8J1T7H0_OWEFU|nr:unnamed protein product [Owenia fusiformis]